MTNKLFNKKIFRGCSCLRRGLSRQVSKAIVGLTVFAMLFSSIPAPARAVFYSPGETLNPACAPTDANCDVSVASFSASGANFASGTSTPATTANQLYNIGGALYWSGSAISGLSGLTSLNGITNGVQTLAIGTSGADFNISSASSTHTFNLPTASSSARGLLSSTDWSTFNNKENAITASTTGAYYRGDKTWQTLNTTAVTEGVNLYYTDARARNALSSSALGLTYATSTGAFSLTSGYNIPLTASTTNWNTFYNTPSNRITAGTGLAWTANTLGVVGNLATTTINGASGPSFTFNTGTTGTDFGISTSTNTLTFNLPSATSSARGLLTASDWTAFNNKESAITASTTATYFRGDKTWQTLNTTAVTEGVNLYYTDARARNALSSSALGLTYATSTGAFSLTSGYNIPLTASTTNWNTFYNTPSNRITAGTGLAWNVNTLAVVGNLATTTINGASGPNFTFNAGAGLAISTSTNSLTFTPSYAGATTDGIVSTSTQTFAGNKTFTGNTALATTTISKLTLSNLSGLLLASAGSVSNFATTTATTGQVLGIQSGALAWVTPTTSATTTINGASGPAFTFNAGAGLAISTSTNSLTFTPSYAGATTDGIVSTSTQTFAGDKTFTATTTINNSLIVDTNTLYVDSTNDRVGIGTAVPITRFNINGAGQTTANLTDSGNTGASLLLNDNTQAAGSGGALLFGGSGTNAKWFAGIKGLLSDGSSNSAGDLAFSTRGLPADTALTEVMRITAGGNVGIGTTTPNNKLHVNGAVTLASSTPATTSNALYNQGGTLYWNGSAMNSSRWTTATNDIYYNTGNVAIGTSTPSAAKLLISGAVAAATAGTPENAGLVSTDGTVLGTAIGGTDTVIRYDSSGTFQAPTGVTNVRILAVAGGGGGGGTDGGGGGAGEYYTSTSFAVGTSSHAITVGAGGIGGAGYSGIPGNSSKRGTQGGDTLFGTFLTVNGGGGGGTHSQDGPTTGMDGGSGGGASALTANSAGGASVLEGAGQGNAGGAVGVMTLSEGAGGGGAGGAGSTNLSNSGSGNGGAGLSSNITGTSVGYAGGGGGGTRDLVLSGAGNAGAGDFGGGRGGNDTGTPTAYVSHTAGVTSGVAMHGRANSGGGGGGGAYSAIIAGGTKNGADGGSGVVIVRFATVPAVPASTASGNALLRVIDTGSVASSTLAFFEGTSGQGCIIAGSTGLSCSSDISLKKNINALDGSLGNVFALKAVTYDWKNGANDTEDEAGIIGGQIGFIAQDVEKIFPGLVVTDPNGKKALSYDRFAPIIVAALQEQYGGMMGVNIASVIANGGSVDELFSSTTTLAAYAEGSGEPKYEYSSIVSNPVGYISERVSAGIKVARTLVAEKMIAVEASFKRIFANELCLTDANGQLVCVTGENLKQIGGQTRALTPAETASVSEQIAPATIEANVAPTETAPTDTTTESSSEPTPLESADPQADPVSNGAGLEPSVEAEPVSQPSPEASAGEAETAPAVETPILSEPIITSPSEEPASAPAPSFSEPIVESAPTVEVVTE